MVDTLQFVDAISGSPTVLLDLNNNAPIYLAGNGWSAPPPPLSRAASNSSARDGTLIAQSAYADRELVLTFGLNTASQDAAAAAIQSLGRMLNSEGQWLKWQPGTTNPVFFRTKRAEIDALEEFNGVPTDGFRQVTIRIPAAPFAYGLVESATGVSIANDPTTGTNRMTYTFPTVKGDVATPLWFKLTQNATTWATLISSTALPTGATHGGPVFTGAFDIAPAAPSGWVTTTSTSDSTAISGFRKRWQRSSGSTLWQDINIGTSYLANVPRGDYRLLVRTKASAVDTTVSGWISGATPSTNAKVVPGSTWGWLDMGVVRAPIFGPRKTTLLDQGHTSRTFVTFRIELPTPGTVDFDELMLVPVGLDDALDTRTAIVGGSLTGTDDLFVDGVNEQTYMRVSSDDSMYPATMVGGFPRVSPNAVNKINFVRLLNVAGDDKTWTTTVDWSYHPMYLYDRPAST